MMLVLKILGIAVLAVLGILLTILLLVLFVPIRYKITAHRKIIEEVPVVAEIKITWLLHILNAAFSYPKAAYVRVRLFCYTIFKIGEKSDSGTEGKKKKPAKKEKKFTKKEKETENRKEEKKEAGSSTEESSNADISKSNADTSNNEAAEEDMEEGGNKFVKFFRKLLELLRNIRYTIVKIYDKIRHVVNNIQYYIKILKSDAFSGAWAVCSKQVLSLLKSIGPRKISGTLLIGTGDPASTGQIMAIYGILYPFIGEHVEITPDFEQQIVEGDLLIKGKITVFKALKTAWIVYFNRDMRRLIKLFKKGGS
ncbi:MAG: DUF2953 domain-containing protein [Clostridium sp.]|nr:DUF2953 domain-containing protein [Clostridium sp.]